MQALSRSLALCSVLLVSASSAATTRRAVMESLPTTGSSIFISTSAARICVGCVNPATTLDVSGTSQFGTTVKSTVSTAGDWTGALNADITLSGPSGFLTTGSSVTASAFFGNGSGLTGVAASVAQATITYNLSGATAETTNFKLCYGTGTLTTGGTAPVVVFYSGDITNSGAAGTYCIINFLQDGAFISPATNAIGMGKSNNAAAGGSGNASTFRVFPAPSSGSHSWCVSMISPFGTTCTFSTGGTYGNQFGVIELR